MTVACPQSIEAKKGVAIVTELRFLVFAVCQVSSLHKLHLSGRPNVAPLARQGDQVYFEPCRHLHILARVQFIP